MPHFASHPAATGARPPARRCGAPNRCRSPMPGTQTSVSPQSMQRQAGAQPRRQPRFLQQILQAPSRRPFGVRTQALAARAQPHGHGRRLQLRQTQARAAGFGSSAVWPPSSGNARRASPCHWQLRSADGTGVFGTTMQFAADKRRSSCAPRSMAMPVARALLHLAYAFRESRLVRHRHAMRAEKIPESIFGARRA